MQTGAGGGRHRDRVRVLSLLGCSVVGPEDPGWGVSVSEIERRGGSVERALLLAAALGPNADDPIPVARVYDGKDLYRVLASIDTTQHRLGLWTTRVIDDGFPGWVYVTAGVRDKTARKLAEREMARW
jgi:hypothetical protein